MQQTSQSTRWKSKSIWLLFGAGGLVIFVIVIMSVSLFGIWKIGNPSAGVTTDMVAPESTMLEKNAARSEGSDVSSTTSTTEQKVMKTGTFTFKVEKVETGVTNIEALAKKYNGSVLNSSVTSESMYTKEKMGFITVRVPVAQFDAFRTDAKKIAQKIDIDEVNATDVTEQYVDLQARLTTMKAEEQSLLKIVEQAKTVDEILKVRAELARVRSDIESMEAQKKYLDTQTDYATVSFTLTEEGIVQSDQFSPSIVFKNAIQALVNAWKQTLSTLIVIGVFAGGLIIPIALVIWITVILFRNKKNKRTDEKMS